MIQWYFVSPGTGNRVGPLDEDAAQAHAQRNPGDQCWREGLGGWQPVRAMPEFASAHTDMPPPVLPPIPGGAKPRGRSDEIDYRIVGNDMPFVEVELDPGESAIAEAGALMYKDASVQMDTVFGDGSSSGQGGGGFMGKLLSAGKRVLTGESLFTTMFTHQGTGKAKVAFAAPYPGTVLAMNLSEHGGRLICQKDSFLAGARGVSVGIHLQRKILTGLFGGEGFIMQKLEGDGWVFVHAGGTLVERELKAGERIDVDTGCVMAYHDTVSMDVQAVGGIKSMLFGGEGVFLATLTGPGKVWLQSLPFSRMAGRMLAAAPQAGGQNRGEGSVLGGLGRLLDGDNNF
ncbi:TIGR00266 family protein [Montanilutibacter psychrotolerans]|uniref:TIGR00266 family protein n=1 Tax=Montanilutibacter psychrotolerans TaxID=1327343 RepID=A0A3M8SYU3_9GAMM|nr:TIGR00266 family protein [Lysobacter psychrotolerans]RNF83702.1 TIGR00266 family protein [Lysobacter psychrotolerans]